MCTVYSVLVYLGKIIQAYVLYMYYMYIFKHYIGMYVYIIAKMKKKKKQLKNDALTQKSKNIKSFEERTTRVKVCSY